MPSTSPAKAKSRPLSAKDAAVAELNEELSLVRLQLQYRSPFFGALVLYLDTAFDTTGRFPTAATNGRKVWINPEFWQSLTMPQRAGLLLHETLHAALLHCSRRGNRNPGIWNIAADFVVNHLIRQANIELPKRALECPYVFHHMDAEGTRPSGATECLPCFPVPADPC